MIEDLPGFLTWRKGKLEYYKRELKKQLKVDQVKRVKVYE